METCVICFEQKKDVSKCTVCMEAGISCHDCDKKWLEAGNDTNICSVCKQHTKSNCFNENNKEEMNKSKETNNREEIDIYSKHSIYTA